MPKTLLEIENLHTYFMTKDGVVKAVNGVSLTLNEDSVLGVVGESGSGKTVTALSILRLVPFPGKIVQGNIPYEGVDLLSLSPERMRRIRGKEISLIFQDAGTALNPVIPIGKQVEEIMLEHTNMGKKQARYIAADLLAQMGIPEARRMLDRYPFQLSGGMAQRRDDGDWGSPEAESAYCRRAYLEPRRHSTGRNASTTQAAKAGKSLGHHANYP